MRDHSNLRPLSLQDLEKARQPFQIVRLYPMGRRAPLDHGATCTVMDYNPRERTVTLIAAGSGIKLIDCPDFQIRISPPEGYTYYLLNDYLALPDVPRQ